MASVVAPKNLVKVKELNTSQAIAKRDEVSATFGKISRIDRKREKLTDAQYEMLKSFNPLSSLVLKSKNVDEILEGLDSIKGKISEARTKAFALRLALNQRRTSRGSIAKFTDDNMIALQEDLFETGLARMKVLVETKKFDIDVIKTYCLMELKTFAMNLRMCMVYKNLTTVLGLEKLPESDIQLIETAAESKFLD